ncbi:hypothetical protein Pint_17564 [Pistacia integerrima]|uniref:Uncharacterized protein n=1 Tax=Pistacia integerrima TaxID=434235 RepID=A0ACC0YWZ8_9ROSI|nr:hypothetical protein Pint_17564 [Pistacia integerrima]
MSKPLEVEIMGTTEIIKPSPPTPDHLRNFNLSLLDQIVPVEYTAVVLFYTGNGDANAAKKSQRLKTSLSQTLSSFYPYAGIIRDHKLVECNDNGVVYIEAYASCYLSDILHQPDQKLLRKFLPIEIESPKAGTGPLLLVQATFFKCGGVALGYCLSHKIGDGNTTGMFITSWAANSLGSNKAVIPKFIATSGLFPPDDSLAPYMDVIGSNYVTKRFALYESKIAVLRAKASSANVPKPTRVESVTALIWKCVTTAARSNRGFPRVSSTVHSMNLRKMVVPPLPDHAAGNIIGDFPAETKEKKLDLPDLVSKLRKGKEEFCKNGLQILLTNKSLTKPEELCNAVENEDIDFYMFSDLSRFQVYESDYGWGTPIWVSIPNYMHNLVMFVSTRDGLGLEAFVTLCEEDMALFERDPELLAFADFNPSVLEAPSHLGLVSRL